MRTHPSVITPNPQPPVTLAIHSAFLVGFWSFLGLCSSDFWLIRCLSPLSPSRVPFRRPFPHIRLGSFRPQAPQARIRQWPPVSQPSWANQVEYQDRLDMANYQQWLMQTCHQPNYLPPPESALMRSAGLSLGRLIRGVGKVTDRPIMSPTPTTIIIMKGRNTGLMRSRMRRMTMVITIAVLTGRADVPHHLSSLVFGASISEGQSRHLWIWPEWFVYPARCRQEVSSQETGLFQSFGCTGYPASEIFSDEGSRGFACLDPGWYF